MKPPLTFGLKSVAAKAAMSTVSYATAFRVCHSALLMWLPFFAPGVSLHMAYYHTP